MSQYEESASSGPLIAGQGSRVIALTVSWPEPPRVIAPTEFFFGAWHPDAPVRVDLRVPLGAAPVHEIGGGNWFLAGTSVRVDGARRSLVHRGLRRREALAFRGYLLDECVEGWADPSALDGLKYGELPSRPNGVFALARITDAGSRLELATDLFGMSPLYFRLEGRLVLFANSPRLLSMEGDELNRLGARALIGGGSLFGEHTLNRHVRRLEPAVRATFSRDGMSLTPWPGLDVIPRGDRPIDEASIEKLEWLFRRSIERCIGLAPGPSILPLSSGHDSRRILGALLEEGHEFNSYTVRVLQKGGRDLDARYAAQMAARMRFPHEVVPLPAFDDVLRLDRARQDLLDAESALQTWMMQLVACFGTQRALVFDGLAGDALSNTGFINERLFELDDARAASLVARIMVGYEIDPLLATGRWPGVCETAAAIEAWVSSLPRGQVREVPFFLGRARRSVAIWSQWLLPAGQTAVYPYLDIDYVCHSLSLDPRQKLECPIQQRSMERFYPEIAALPGSRGFPSNLPAESLRPGRANQRAVLRGLVGELRGRGRYEQFLEELAPRARWQTRLGVLLSPILAESGWWFRPLAEVVLCESLARPSVQFHCGSR